MAAKCLVNHTKQHYLTWIHLGRVDSNISIKRFGPCCPNLPWRYQEVRTSGAYAPHRLAGQRLYPFPPQPALPGLSCWDTLSRCISCALPLAFWASHQHLPPTPGCCTSQGIHGKLPTNNILQLRSAASSVRRHCQAPALRDLMRGTLHNEAGKGWGIIPCLAAAVNTTAINNHSLKPQYSFTSPQLPHGIRRMVARGHIAWPKLPAKYPLQYFWVQISLIITCLCA